VEFLPPSRVDPFGIKRCCGACDFSLAIARSQLRACELPTDSSVIFHVRLEALAGSNPSLFCIRVGF
jgi:hypothetical protein